MSETGNIKLLNMDCMDFMASCKDKEFDLALVDPPYFSGPEKREYYGQKISSIGVKRLYKKSHAWNMPAPEYFKELERIAKKYIVWGCNYFDYHFHSGRIVWDKVNDSSDYSDCEIAATNLFSHIRIFRFMWNGMLQGSLIDGKKMEGNKKLNQKRIHPTEKPIQLYKWLLYKYAKPNDKIIDTHGGSMSHAIATHDFNIIERMNLSLTIMEIDKDYYEAALKRFNLHASQGKLQLT